MEVRTGSTSRLLDVDLTLFRACIECSNEEMVSCLQSSAVDLGDEGIDDYYGYGLVQADATYTCLAELSCCANGLRPPPDYGTMGAESEASSNDPILTELAGVVPTDMFHTEAEPEVVESEETEGPIEPELVEIEETEGPMEPVVIEESVTPETPTEPVVEAAPPDQPSVVAPPASTAGFPVTVSPPSLFAGIGMHMGNSGGFFSSAP